MLGAYRISVVTGAITATLGAASTLLSLRWGDATRLLALDYVKINSLVVGAITTGVLFNLELILARSFTASDTLQTSVLPTGNSQKMRTSFGTTLITDFRIANTAGITAGTRTVDTQPIGLIRSFTGTAANTPIFGIASNNSVGAGAADVDMGSLFRRDFDGRYPVVLSQNEGILVRNPLAGPATGTFNIQYDVGWFEANAY